MGLFGNKRPKLPSFAGYGLEALLENPEWAYPISQAGINPSNCEVVLRLSDATIGLGRLGGGVPVNAAPAILFGQGNVLAMAYPDEREVKVARRDISRAELQTQRSGWFQILFGPPQNLDGFMFWGAPDNLQLGTPEGEAFGRLMSAFLRGQLQPQQVFGTPQSLVESSGPGSGATQGPTPDFEDQDDTLRWEMLHSLHSALAEMMDQYQECFEQAEKVERAFGMANAEYVDGVRQHPISRENFRKMAVQMEEDLGAPLAVLRAKTAAAAAQWKDLLFLLPGDDADVMKISKWAASNGVDSEVFSYVISNGVFIYTDFGLTKDSFWTENQRVISVLEGSGQ